MKIGKFSLFLMTKYLRHSDNKVMRGWPSIDTYRHRVDVDALGDGDFFHQFDIFYANEGTHNGDTVIDIHGGAYIYGDRKNNFGFARIFLEKGYHVVLLDYPHNRGKRDCLDQVGVLAKQLSYLYEHAEELGLNKNRFFLYGDSAGGHYALLLAELASNPEFQRQIGLKLPEISFLAIGLSCPVYNFRRTAHAPLLSKRGRDYMYGKRWNEESFVSALDASQHLEGLKTPVILSSCHNDFLKQESIDLDADAKSLGLDLEFHFLETEDMKVGHVHNVMHPELGESEQINEYVHRFFQAKKA